MYWNISAECISAVIVCIVMVYSQGGEMVPTVKNRIFKICVFITLIAIISNIISALMIYNYTVIPLWLTWSVTTIYFIVTPLIGALYLLYIIAAIYEVKKEIYSKLWVVIIPYLIYFIMVFMNFFTRDIFSIEADIGYIRGPRILSTYIVFYIYCILCFIMIFKNGRIIERGIKKILYTFPAIATLLVVVQQVWSTFMLSGFAAACTLLIVYLYFQNKRITIDLLTGLPNRQAFLKMLELEMESYSKKKLWIVVISLNGFKFINDKFGQKNGNYFLLKVCEYLKSIVNVNHLYRYGGDEFAIILDSKEDRNSILLSLKTRFNQPWNVETYQCSISAGMGVTEYPGITETMDEILNGIEYTVNKAKEGGKTNLLYCTKDMLGEIKRKNAIIDILREKILNDGFEIYYQPILSVSKNRFLGAESLLRLKDAEMGQISPAEFVPIAEETGMIIEISYLVLDKVCKFIKDIENKGIEIDSVSVNLSVIQFMQENLESRIIDIISGNKISFSKIKFEITESIVTSNYEVVRNFMIKMKEKGIQFCLDDFGTGFSNIAAVIDLPFDIIKLDKSLVWSSLHNEKCAVIVTHVSKAFKKVGMHILAEGVETWEQNQFSIECGCELIQGFLWAKPMPNEAAEEVFKGQMIGY